MGPEPAQLLDDLATAVVVIGADQRIRYVNSAAEALFGASARTLLAMPVEALLPDAPLPGHLARATETGEPFTTREFPLSIPGGTRAVTVDLSVTPVGEPVDHLVLELAELDRHLRISREESLVAQRAATHSLVRGLAHEIKNPLGGLRGAAQLLERELDDEGLREYTRVIIGEADRLTTLVDAMLGPTRAPTRVPTNIHEVTDRVAQLLGAETGAGVTITREYDPSIPEVRIDPDQIVQALLNLARNGIQAMDTTGALTLRTRIERQVTIGRTRHRQAVCIDVADTGPGVDATMREQIFFPLVTTRPDGTGLGLPIAQGLVARHDGVIDCTSEPGATVFTVRIPLEDTE